MGPFDRVVRIAAGALRAPIALLTLDEQEGQFLKSGVGLAAEARRHLSRSDLLLDRVARTDGALALADLRSDGVEADFAPVSAEPVRAFLGRALRGQGRVVGMLAVLDTRPRDWGSEELAILDDLAEAAMAEVRSLGQSEGLRRTRQALRQSEERFRSLIEKAADVISILSAGGTIDYTSPSIEGMAGYTPAELQGKNVFALLHPSDAPGVIARFSRLVRGAECEDLLDCRIRHKNGSWRTIEVRVNNLLQDPAVAGIVLNARDVTDVREAEETQQRLNAFLEATPDFVATFDPHGRALSVNAAFRRVLGLEEDEDLTAITLADLFPRSVTELILHQGIPVATRQGIWVGETMLHGPEGEEIPVSQVILAHKSENGQLEFLSTLARDIREQKHAEEALRRSEQHFRSLIENALDVITILDTEGRVVFESPSIERILGYRPDELVGTQTLDRVHPEDQALARKTLLAGGGTASPTSALEIRVRHKDGSWRTLEAMAENLLDDPAVAGIVVHSRDVTERKAAEIALQESQEQLLQSQKMEAVGRLAGGVAHDFNNLLTAIKGFTELLLLDLDERDPRQAFVTEIQSAANRAAGLTRQLLAFSRKQVLQPRVMDLNESVADLEKMLQRLIGEDVELETIPGKALAAVRADPGQVEQVLVNLVVNARDAMPNGGRLVLRTANVELNADEIPAMAEAEPGDYVMLSVTDTGTGMAPEVQDRIFEPFFTTKGKGKGTGLGLATVYGIVQQSGGFVAVESELGKGTTFCVYLPAVQEAVERSSRSGPAAAPVQGSETILLVEDELAVRVLIRRVLGRNGYRVLEAPSGRDALAILEEWEQPVDLLLTDVVMPGMSGRELADTLALEHPNMRVLYMSGYTDEAIVHHGVLDPGIALLEKPFTPDVLLRKLREILGAPAEVADR